MRIRKILICLLTGLLCLSIFCPKAVEAAQTPQEFVKEFYAWYLIKDYDLSDALKQEVLPGFPWVTPVRNWPGRGLDRHRRSRWLS